MFRTLWSLIKEAFGKMIGTKTVADALKIMPIFSDKMADAIELWDLMYKGRAPWVREPDMSDPTRIVSLGIPAFIASEKARMATLEMVSEITDPDADAKDTDKNGDPNRIEQYSKTGEKKQLSRAEFLNRTYQRKVLKNIRTQLEYGIAKGGLIIKPYVYKKSDGYDIDVEFIHADGFFPLAFDSSGKMTEAAFVQNKIDKGYIYRRLEHHKLENDKVIVRNMAFETRVTNNNYDIINQRNMTLGQEIPLSTVPEWAALSPETTIEHVDRLLFAYYKQPEANIVDPYSPLGISGFGRAVELIKDADIQYSRLIWEFEATEAAIDIDRDALTDVPDKDGIFHVTRPYLQKRLFRKLDLGDDATYEPYNPTIRDESLINGLNSILTKIEDACSLSRGTLSFNEKITIKTATELKILKQRSYSANSEVQRALGEALKECVYIMDVYCSLYDITPEGKYDVSLTWDDSILTDNNEELQKMILMMQHGVVSKEEIRRWYFGETATQAAQALEIISEENKKAMKENAELQALIAQETYTNQTTNYRDKTLPQGTDSVRNQVKNNTENNKNSV